MVCGTTFAGAARGERQAGRPTRRCEPGCRRREGIKAILIYPMNALATDQTRRIAETIHRTPSLRGQVSAGLYVGEGERSPHTAMGPDHVISDRDTLRERPPDILPTNCKMLDFLLIRPVDHRLWRHNEPDTLRYLVVDELHTFDGAQGTDLACLVRRLRSRLGVTRERLICVGTSATIGGDENREDLLSDVSRIFDQPFDVDAIVGEVRQSIDEFLGASLISRSLFGRDDLAERVDHTRYGTVENYVRAQHELFFGDPIEGDFDGDDWRLALARRLREHLTFVNLLRVLEGRPKPFAELVQRLRPNLPVKTDREAAGVLNALCALVSVARARAGAVGNGALVRTRSAGAGSRVRTRGPRRSGDCRGGGRLARSEGCRAARRAAGLGSVIRGSGMDSL